MRDWRLRQTEILAIFLFWMALATLSALNRLVDPRGGGLRFVSPSGPIVLGYLESLLWAVLTPAIFFIAAWAMRDRTHLIVRVAVLAAAGMAVAYLSDTILDLLRFEVFRMGRRRPPLVVALMTLRGGFANQLFVYAAVLTAGFARELAERDRIRRRQTEELAMQAAHLRSQLSDARLEALRMQINPHFLFNTLNAISALVERDPAGVRRMIARLSDLLRYSLDTSAGGEVPLREELAFVSRYVEIMTVRFQDRLQFTQNVEAGAEEALVPSLILQPLVENALKHGVSATRAGGRVELSARRAGDRLIVSIADDGPGPGQETSDAGIGLANTRERLRQMYGDAAGVSLRAAGLGTGTIAELAIPWRSAS
jgi:two-component sensor histidine kinase